LFLQQGKISSFLLSRVRKTFALFHNAFESFINIFEDRDVFPTCHINDVGPSSVVVFDCHFGKLRGQKNMKSISFFFIAKPKEPQERDRDNKRKEFSEESERKCVDFFVSLHKSREKVAYIASLECKKIPFANFYSVEVK
jgi:hypothetical protein